MFGTIGRAPARRWLALGALAMVVALASWRPWARQGPEKSEAPTTDVAPIDQVEWSEAKAIAAGARVEKVAPARTFEELGVPGRIEADHDLSVTVRARCAALVKRVLVRHGQKVEAGAALAVLESAEVAEARAKVLARRRALELARSEADWRATVAKNLGAMIADLNAGTSLDQVQARFRGAAVGARRGEVVGAAAAWLESRAERDKQAALVEKKFVTAPKLAVARRSESAARAAFDAAVEQARHDADREKALADQGALGAQDDLGTALMALSLLGAKEAPYDGVVGAFLVEAPFAATVLDRAIAPGQRVAINEGLFPLADLSHLHLVAMVPESMAARLPSIGTQVAFVVPSTPGRTFVGELHAIGGQVGPQSRTIEALVEVENSDGAWRLGESARVELRREEGQVGPSVPSAAVVQDEGREAVFVKTGPYAYRRTFVELGPERQGRRAVRAGLKGDEEVVVVGAFLLKSELALINAPEEE